jgi:hypothetical protein
VHDTILGAFPALSQTGYKFLRVSTAGGRELQVIECPTEGFTVSYLKAYLGHAKYYLRPVLNDIVPEETSTKKPLPKGEKYVLMTCSTCKSEVPMHTLRVHLEQCERHSELRQNNDNDESSSFGVGVKADCEVVDLCDSGSEKGKSQRLTDDDMDEVTCINALLYASTVTLFE